MTNFFLYSRYRRNKTDIASLTNFRRLALLQPASFVSKTSLGIRISKFVKEKLAETNPNS